MLYSSTAQDFVFSLRKKYMHPIVKEHVKDKIRKCIRISHNLAHENANKTSNSVCNFSFLLTYLIWLDHENAKQTVLSY